MSIVCLPPILSSLCCCIILQTRWQTSKKQCSRCDGMDVGCEGGRRLIIEIFHHLITAVSMPLLYMYVFVSLSSYVFLSSLLSFDLSAKLCVYCVCVCVCVCVMSTMVLNAWIMMIKVETFVINCYNWLR